MLLPSLQAIVAERIGDVRERFDEVRAALGETTRELTFPTIVVVGSESAGKSTVLSRLVGHNVFPQGDSLTTRCPTELRLVPHEAAKWPTFLRRHGLPEGSEFAARLFCESFYHSHGGWSGWLVGHEAVYNEVGGLMAHLLAPYGGHGISSQPIVMEIASPKVAGLTLVDLPGLVTYRQPEEPSTIQEDTIKLVKSYVARRNTLIVAVVDGTPQHIRGSAPVLGIVQELNAQPRTIGVLTKSDLCPAARLRDRLVGASTRELMPLEPFGYVALRNMVPDSGETLEASAMVEAQFFKKVLEDSNFAQRTGIGTLMERMCDLLISHTMVGQRDNMHC